MKATQQAITADPQSKRTDVFRVVHPQTLAQRIDDLGELRNLLRQSQDAEKRLTAEIKVLLIEAGAKEGQGAQFIATLGERVDTVIDPQLFLEATGPKGLVAVTVGVTKARELMSGEDLAAISEAKPVPVLNVKPLGGAK
jgi:hypothetical protein